MNNRAVRWRARAGAAFALAAAAAVAWSLIVVLTGGVALAAGVTSKDPARPLLGAAGLLVLALVADARATCRLLIGIAGRGPALARRVAIAASVALSLAAVAWNSAAAGGSDSSCYVLQADALRHGQLALREPLAREIPIARPDAFFAPTGFVASPVERGAAVPICGPGLAIAMTVASVAGARAMWLVVPGCAALLVWATFVLGRRIDGDMTGAVSSVLVACSPIVLYQSVQPMSDVPAAALLIAALAAVGRRDVRGAVAGGALASAAVLVRPNLALAVPLFALFLLLPRVPLAERARQVIAFAAAALPCIVALAWLNARRYGSPFVSGYGETGVLFAMTHVGPNVGRYLRWLLSTETPFVLLAAGAPWWAWKRRAESRARHALLALLTALLVIGTFLFYAVFDDWWYVRFLLPAIPLLLILAVAVLLGMTGANSPARVALGIVTCVVLVTVFVSTIRSRHVLNLRALESRFVMTGRYTARALPPDAIVLAVQESGAVRYHGGHQTAMWDQLQPGELDGAIAWLADHGRPVFIALEDGEEPKFRARFPAERYGRLEWPPRAEIHSAVRVAVYAAADRATFFSGARMSPEHVR